MEGGSLPEHLQNTQVLLRFFHTPMPCKCAPTATPAFSGTAMTQKTYDFVLKPTNYALQPWGTSNHTVQCLL